MKEASWKGKTALITGASSGLGAEFARQLAPHVRNLHLVARRHDRLIELQSELLEKHQLNCTLWEVDLVDRRAVEAMVEKLPTIDLLINNAGLGDLGEFAGSSWERNLRMIEVNILALTHLTHRLLPHMITQKSGAILNVSSLASSLFIPDFAVYAATKAYVTHFSEALRIELRDRGISVTALCPGPVPTEFGKVARRASAASEEVPASAIAIDAAQVVREGLRALARNRARHFPGWKVRSTAILLRILPLNILRLVLKGRPRRQKD